MSVSIWASWLCVEHLNVAIMTKYEFYSGNRKSMSAEEETGGFCLVVGALSRSRLHSFIDKQRTQLSPLQRPHRTHLSVQISTWSARTDHTDDRVDIRPVGANTKYQVGWIRSIYNSDKIHIKSQVLDTLVDLQGIQVNQLCFTNLVKSWGVSWLYIIKCQVCRVFISFD